MSEEKNAKDNSLEQPLSQQDLMKDALDDKGESTQEQRDGGTYSLENKEQLLQLIKESNKEKNTAELRNYRDLEVEYHYRDTMRIEQEKRTEEITKLFVNYREQQEKRYKYKDEMKPQLVRFLFSLIFAIGVIFVLFLLVALLTQEIDGADIVMIVASFVTCLGSILSIVLIIVKYIFPEEEDKDFNDLIKAIITNDTVRIKDDNVYQIDKSKASEKKRDD